MSKLMRRNNFGQWKTRSAVVCMLIPLAWSSPASAGDADGFLYGKIETRRHTYEGRIRWDDEEAFWGDFFNSNKDDLPHRRFIPPDYQPQRRKVDVLGVSLTMPWSEESVGRSFQARFGDIRQIVPRGGSDAEIIMKSGSRYDVESGSNDLGARLFIWDRDRGKVKLDWRRIQSIEFMSAPTDLEVDVFRLHGRISTTAGEFRGWIQWDKEECLSTDELDGDTPDGRRKSIAMGDIEAIERHSERASRVTLRDGEELLLDGTNDVDDDNRGIYVEDERFGRVLVHWRAFRRLDFSPPGASGPAYEDFLPGTPLRGTVELADSKKYQGDLVYDVDESETWEILSGRADGLEYEVPMELIAEVVPNHAGSGSTVRLRGGEELELSRSADVSEGNAGIVVLTAGRQPVFLPWPEVRRIVFTELHGKPTTED